MLLLPPSVRILLAAEPVDLRKSIDGLSALVRTQWKENLYAGHLFVFVSRRGNRVKILSWDKGGFVITYKRLEKGRFRLPRFHEGALGAQLDATQLAMLLDGIEMGRVQRPKKWSPAVQVGDRQAPESFIYPDRWQPARRATATNVSGASVRKRSKSAMPGSPKPSSRSRGNSRR